MSNPLVELMKLGQSIWYDNIRRALLVSGDLQKKIDEAASPRIRRYLRRR